MEGRCDKQLKTLVWLKNKLSISKKFFDDVRETHANSAFGLILADALNDGIVTNQELESMNAVSRHFGLDVQTFVKNAFSRNATDLLLNAFANSIANGRLDQKVWSRLVKSANVLGIAIENLTNSVCPMAQRFAEQALSDAKADGQIDQSEEIYLQWLIQSFNFSPTFKSYINEEIDRIKRTNQINLGHLPILDRPAQINFKSGELLHFGATAEMLQTRKKRDGQEVSNNQGVLLLTDQRVVFYSHEKSQSFSYSNIVGYQATDEHFICNRTNKPQLRFEFSEQVDLAGLLISTIIALHNQTLVRKIDSKVDRYIPRDVRNRIWQRYGGQCIECKAKEYLEFDHIIPVAKGGSNTEKNIQLLCRNCNLKKSDNI